MKTHEQSETTTPNVKSKTAKTKGTKLNQNKRSLRQAAFFTGLVALVIFPVLVLALIGFCVLSNASATPQLSLPVLLTAKATQIRGAKGNRTLTFADRVAYQRAIEEVYWQHRIWPKANAGPKPPLEKVMSQVQIEKKVEDYLHNSQALEDYWQRPITPDQLQIEMERIASHTKQPGVLREIFSALGNDPFVIAECLARPVLAERLLPELYAHDTRFHGELKRRAEAQLQTHPSVKQMKQTSGMYTEMEWIKSDDADVSSNDAPGVVATPLRGVRRDVPPAFAALRRDEQACGHSERQGTPDGVTMTSREWSDGVEKLAKDFGNTKAGGALAQIKTGVLSPLKEDEGHYYAVVVMNKGEDRLKLATIAWLKEPLRSWVSRTETQVPLTMAAVSASYALPVIASPSDGCTDDTWTPTSITNAPAGRNLHSAVWTGSEMIVWGGADNISYFNTGGRYNPSTDSWTATSTTNAPTGRAFYVTQWTGSEMIVWGGFNGSLLNTGGRYNPSTDSWTATSTTNAPSARQNDFGSVWTGSEMIVWGGFAAGTRLNTGGRYNPSTDSWTATSTTNAPSARNLHTAVWIGSEMIVWGGVDASLNFVNTGGRYNPGTDSWTATSTTSAPAARGRHQAVVTETEMIVWGGIDAISYFNTGGRYDPSTDSWTATSTTNAPSGRFGHRPVWTGIEMIVWGGTDNVTYFNTGGRYNPGNDSWTATSTNNAPDGRYRHTAVWTGDSPGFPSQMMVWGGYDGATYFNTGGRYCVPHRAPPPHRTPPPHPTPRP